jgi:hypothetical protein
MRRILHIRIVRWELKLLFVVGALVIGFPISAVLYTVGAAPLAVSIVNTVAGMALLLLGARIFRGRGEAVEPPRPWWRMTARPTLSRRLGILFLVLAAWLAAGLILAVVVGFASIGWTADDIVIAVSGVLEFAAVASLYLNSAARLKRMGVPAKDLKFRPTVSLKP